MFNIYSNNNPFETAHIIFGEIKSPKYARVSTHYVVQSCLYLDSIGEFIHLFHSVFVAYNRVVPPRVGQYITHKEFISSAHNITTFRSLNLHTSFIHIRELFFLTFYTRVGNATMIRPYQKYYFKRNTF